MKRETRLKVPDQMVQMVQMVRNHPLEFNYKRLALLPRPLFSSSVLDILVLCVGWL